jgi:hypothetical protein
MTDSTTRRAEEIREETGLSWPTSCTLAELERDGGTMPVHLAETVRAHNSRQDSLGSCYVGTLAVEWPPAR